MQVQEKISQRKSKWSGVCVCKGKRRYHNVAYPLCASKINVAPPHPCSMITKMRTAPGVLWISVSPKTWISFRWSKPCMAHPAFWRYSSAYWASSLEAVFATPWLARKALRSMPTWRHWPYLTAGGEEMMFLFSQFLITKCLSINKHWSNKGHYHAY